LHRNVILYYIIICIKRNNFNKNNFGMYGFSSSSILKVSKFLFILNYYFFCLVTYFLCLMLFDMYDVVGIIYVPSHWYFELFVDFLYLHSCVMPTNRGNHRNTIERYISKLSKQNLHVNDNHVITKYRFSIHSSYTTKNETRTLKNTHWTDNKI
jgi:hypothetical protein